MRCARRPKPASPGAKSSPCSGRCCPNRRDPVMSAALEIRGLRKSFKHFTLGPLDLTVPTGSIYAYVGPNAAGKTTTIDLISGMGAKDDGSIRVLGLDHIK